VAVEAAGHADNLAAFCVWRIKGARGRTLPDFGVGEKIHSRLLFETHGTMERVNFVTDRTGRLRGFGFVEMTDAVKADRAIAGLNGHELALSRHSARHSNQKMAATECFSTVARRNSEFATRCFGDTNGLIPGALRPTRKLRT
jgi:hypothetical protein